MRMAGFDIFLLPSLFEGLPLALLEAMHAGLPIIATRTDGTPDAIDSGVSGMLCGDGDEFTNALLRVTENGELRHRFGSAARDVARRRFSTAAMADQVLDVYKEQMRARPARSI